MRSRQHELSAGYFVLTVLGLILIQALFFAPQSVSLSLRDFKTLLKGGQGCRPRPGGARSHRAPYHRRVRGTPAPGLIKALRTRGPGEQRCVTVQREDPTLG